MLTIREVIKTLYNALLQRLKKHRGNWEQNDPTADDYIKNRPFYTDETNKEIIVKTTNFTATSSYWWGSPFAFIPVVGETYKVTFDGKEYICTAYLSVDAPAIGNASINDINDNGPDTGEPFFYYWYDSYDYGMCVRDQGKHTITIEKIKVVKIDERYLPENNNAEIEMAIDDLYDYANYLDNEVQNKVSYTRSQNLSASQQQTARTNIGAAATSDLATVANTGDYNDLENKPCSKIITDAAYVGVSGCSYIEGKEGHAFKFTSFPTIDDSQYVAFKLTAYKNSSTVYLQTEYVQHHDYQYKYNGTGANYNRRIWGNANLVDFTLPNTGENWFVYCNSINPSTLCVGVDGLRDKVDLLSSGWFGYSIRNIEIVQLSEELIPETIARVSDLPTLAPVATTGSYNDLVDKPVYEEERLVDVYRGEYTSLWYANPNHDSSLTVMYPYTPLFTKDSLQESLIAGEQYTFTSTYKKDSLKSATITGTMEFYEHRSDDYLYSFYIFGNKHLLSYQSPPFSSMTTLPTWDIVDTGETICFFAYVRESLSTPAIEYLRCYAFGTVGGSSLGSDCDILLVRHTADLKQLDEKFIPSTIARTEDIVQSDWNETDETSLSFIKNKPDFDATKNYITLVDQINGFTYLVCMRDGNLTSFCATQNISATMMPNKTEYIFGECFDPAGMVITATAYDGAFREITSYTYLTEPLVEGTTSVEITYTENNVTHTTNVPITVLGAADALVDFEYTDNGDGTYTIIDWKGTENGEVSTRIVIPDSQQIIL